MDGKYDVLKLDRQLCFPLYACAKEIVRRYTPHLEAIGLTYTQYLVMMVMWERKSVNVTELGRRLYLDSGTLTPVLKKLEQKGLVTRARCKGDERCLDVCITDEGEALKDRAAEIPEKVAYCVDLSEDDAKTLYGLLYKALGALN